MCSDEEVSKMINFLTLEHPDFASHPLESFCMKQAANQHARAEFTIRLDADKWNNRLAQQLYNSEQGICTQDGTIIFRGILEDIEIIRQHGYVLFHGTLISGSVLLDTRPRCRSFQNPNMTWGQILETVIQEYPHGTLLKNCVDYDKSIGRPIIQYQETDWEFLNRIASRCQACIYPDISQPWARCSLGIPLSRKDSFVISPTVYTRTMSRSFYQEGGKAAGRFKADFATVTIKSTRNYDVGTAIRYQRQEYRIVEKELTLQDEEVGFTYLLAHEAYLVRKPQYNEKVSGVSLIGTVLATAGETVKLHLDIDSEQDRATAYPYSWVPTSNNLMYLMPQVGTKAILYIPNHDEQNAEAIGCVRTNGGIDSTCQPMADYQNRSLTTEHGKKLYLNPGDMGASGAGGALCLTDGDKLSFQSTGKVTIKAQDSIHIRGKTVDLSALTQIRLVVAGSEINLNNLHDHGADGKVWYIGTTSQVLEPVTQPRKTNTPRGPDFSDLMPHVLGTIPQYMKGIFDSGVENFSLGCIHPQEPQKWSLGYKTGRQVGDALSIGAGKGIIGIGTDIGTSGAVVSVGSLGTASAVSVPVSVLGFTLAAYGSAVAVKSATSFAADASHPIKCELNSCDGKNKVTTGTDYDSYRKRGETFPNHKVDPSGNSLDRYGEPNSSMDQLNPDGTVKQRRYYDQEGRAIEDIDYNHTDDGTHKFPHRHKWEWDGEKSIRLETEDRIKKKGKK